jgi:regulator of replication initiation timing
MKVRLRLTPMFNTSKKLAKTIEQLDQLVKVVAELDAEGKRQVSAQVAAMSQWSNDLDLTDAVAKHADAESLKGRTVQGDLFTQLSNLAKQVQTTAEDVALLNTDYLSLVEANRELGQKFDALVAYLKVEVIMDPVDFNAALDAPTTFHVQKIKAVKVKAPRKPPVKKAPLHKAASLDKVSAKKASSKKIK